MAYWRLEPFGDDWRQSAEVAAAVSRQWAKEPVRADDFLPPGAARTTDRPQTDAEQVAEMDRFLTQYQE